MHTGVGYNSFYGSYLLTVWLDPGVMRPGDGVGGTDGAGDFKPQADMNGANGGIDTLGFSTANGSAY